MPQVLPALIPATTEARVRAIEATSRRAFPCSGISLSIRVGEAPTLGAMNDLLGHLNDDELYAALLHAVRWAFETHKNELLNFESQVLWGLVIREHAQELESADLKTVHQRLIACCRRLDSHGRRGAHREHLETQRLLSAAWRLIGAGIVYPRLREIRDGEPAAIDYLVVTPIGARVLSSTTPHPLDPEFLSHLRSEAPNLPDDVVLRLQDAADCLRQGLLRASVVMLGLAFEQEIESILDELLRPEQPPWRARERIAKLATIVDHLPKKEREKRHRAQIALAAADIIRTHRNRASHPGDSFESRDEVEDLLCIGVHQLHVLESLRPERESSSAPE